MKKGIVIFTFLCIFFGGIFAQLNPDDFWLNNGFTDGGSIITNSGFFYDDGGSDIYQENQDWTVRFCSENGNPISFDFSGFATHYGGTLPPDNQYLLYDYMSVDYPDASYVVYHDDTPEFSFTSQSSCIDFAFHSNGDGLIDSGWVAEIYALPPPFNNDPVDAEDLVVGNVCSPAYYTNKGAYNSTGLGSPPCKTYYGGDVWFKLVVPATGVVKIETFAGSLTYAILDIFSSTNSDILVSERISCVDDGGVMPSVVLSAPTVSPGETLYIRLFGEQAKSGLFGICASDPSAPITGFIGPGGVGDSLSVDFWFKADEGVLNSSGTSASDNEQVRTWSDQSGNEKHLVQTNSGLQAIYSQDLINSFGGLVFDGSNDLYNLESGSGDSPLHWFVAGSFIGNQRQTMISIGDANIDKTASISKHSDQRYFDFTSIDRYGPLLTDSEFYIFHASHVTNTPYHYLELNGLSQTVDAVPSALETDGSVHVGAAWDGTEPFNGSISELIQFRKTLNQAQEIIVNNYLAAKYNITPDIHDYYSWKNSYHFDVAGIGQVDASNAHTKAQSAGILAISGADDLDDDEFLFFGHDNGDFTTWSSANVPVGDTNIVRLDRLWRIDLVNGDPGALSLSLEISELPTLPSGFVAYNIYIDDDGDFSAGAIANGPFEIGDELVINNITLNDGDYLAIAAVRPVLTFTSNNGESLESVSNPSIEVQLNYAISIAVEVDYIVSGGTAVQGTDYSLLPSSIIIDPGLKLGNIIPLIIEDTIPEIPDEYFDIDISSSTPGITMGPFSSNRYTILNNDLGVEASYISDSIIGECAASASELKVEALGTGPFTYTWTPAGTLNIADNDTVIANPVSTTLYTVEVRDGLGQSKSDTIRVTVIPAPSVPVITVHGSNSFCEGDSVKLSTVSGYSSYYWSTLETDDNIWVKTGGAYNVVVRDSFGCSGPVSAEEVITVFSLPDPPAITIVGSATFCNNDSVLLIAEVGYSSYLWSDMSLNDSLVVKSAGDYYISGTDTNGCLSDYSDTIDILVLDNPLKPVVTADGATTFCADDSVKLSAPVGYAEYLWSSLETSEEIYVTAADSYDVIVTDANGCSSMASAPVAVAVLSLPPQPAIVPDGPLSFCEGGSVNMDVSSSSSLYTWSDGVSDMPRLIELAGEYAVRVEDINGCISPYSDSVMVEIYPLPGKPMITVSDPLDLITGDSVTLTAILSDAYLWSPGAETTQAIIVKTSGDYSVKVENSFGCESEVSDIVTVSVSDFLPAPEITVSGSLGFCPGGEIVLSGPDGFTVYDWSNGGSTQQITVSEAGHYTLVITDASGHVSLPSEEVIVEVYDLPSVSLISVTEPLCHGDANGMAQVVATGGTAPYSFNWSNAGGNDDMLNNVSAGTYIVTVLDQNLCSAEIEITIEQPEQIELSYDITPAYCPDFVDGSIDLLIVGGTYPYSVEWEDGTIGAYLSNIGPGTYNFTIYDANNCTLEEGVEVAYINEVCFTIPEVITPNGDGYNDLWLIEGLEVYSEVVIEVFDRWGKRVFYSEGHSVYFDGTYEGKVLPMESYHYFIDLNNGSDRIIGNITIIR